MYSAKKDLLHIGRKEQHPDGRSRKTGSPKTKQILGTSLLGAGGVSRWSCSSSDWLTNLCAPFWRKFLSLHGDPMHSLPKIHPFKGLHFLHQTEQLEGPGRGGFGEEREGTVWGLKTWSTRHFLPGGPARPLQVEGRFATWSALCKNTGWCCPKSVWSLRGGPRTLWGKLLRKESLTFVSRNLNRAHLNRG